MLLIGARSPLSPAMQEVACRWICCQLGAREHYAVARGLHRHHALELLLTDAWVRPASPLGAAAPGLRGRFHHELAEANVHAANLGGIAFELRARLSGLQGWPRIMARNAWFQRMVVAHLSRLDTATGPRTVMAYSYAALDILRLARARGWRTVLGQIDPGPPEERIVARLYREDPMQRDTWQPPPPEYWALWRQECALADRIVVNSQWSRSALVEEGVPQSRIEVVPLAFDPPETAAGFERRYPAAFDATRPLRALFLGQVNLRKGIGPLLEAIRLLRGAPIEISFVGPVQVAIPQDLRDDPQVRWVGPVARDDTARCYREADVFLFPTFSDGFGLTQLEAMAWKLPVIASRFCGEVVRDGENGWILPEVTAEAIVAALRRCLADPAGLQRLSDGAATTRGFDLAQVGARWL